MYYYEFKKILNNKTSYFILMLGFVLIFIWSLIFVGRNYDTSLNGFYRDINGTLTKEKQETLEDEYKKAYSEVFTETDEGMVFQNESMELSGKYCDNRFEDFCALTEMDALINLIKKRESYLKSNQIKKAEIGEEAYHKYFDDEEEHVICNRNLIPILIDNQFPILIGISIMIILCAGCLILEEKNHTSLILATTKYGYQNNIACKMRIVFLLSIMIQIILNFEYYLICMIRFPISKWELIAPLFYAKGFELCPGNYTVVKYIIFELLAGIITTFFFSMFTIALSCLLKRKILSIVISEICFAISIAINIIYDYLYHGAYTTDSEYIISTYAFGKFYEIWRLINPFAFVQLKYYFEQPRFLITDTFVIDKYLIPLLIVCLFIILFDLFTKKKYQFARRVLTGYE